MAESELQIVTNRNKIFKQNKQDPLSSLSPWYTCKNPTWNTEVYFYMHGREEHRTRVRALASDSFGFQFWVSVFLTKERKNNNNKTEPKNKEPATILSQDWRAIEDSTLLMMAEEWNANIPEYFLWAQHCARCWRSKKATKIGREKRSIQEHRGSSWMNDCLLA